MNVEELREYCLSLNGTMENQPWSEPQYQMLMTFTVGGKWYCIADLDKKFIDVKSSPDRVQKMQGRYQGCFPAWHMNKEHWLGVTLESDVPDEIIKDLLKGGYELIISRLPKKTKEELGLI